MSQTMSWIELSGDVVADMDGDMATIAGMDGDVSANMDIDFSFVAHLLIGPV